jgi:hypothetical protein
MSKQLLIILTFVLTNTFVVGQIYTGISDDKYQILLQINKDSSVNYSYSREQEFYSEHIGTIRKINDTLFHISATMTFGNDMVLSLYTYDTISHVTNDTDYFCFNYPDTVILKYANGLTKNYFPYSKQGKDPCFVLDKKLFNEKSGSNYYTVTFKRKNIITGQPLTFKLGQHSGLSILSGQKIDFDVIIKNNNLRTINGYLLQTKDFKIKRKSGT